MLDARVLRRAAVLAAALLTAAGCDAGPPEPPPGPAPELTDPDRDGVSGERDCAPADPAAHTEWTVYVDTDGDGLGAGEPVLLCAGRTLPAGHAPAGGDCAPADAQRWALQGSLFADADGDGATRGDAATVCAGAGRPAGYRTERGAEDCDDADAAAWVGRTLHADADGDGVGAGPALPACTGPAVPSGWSEAGGDCAPDDSAAWRLFDAQARDADGDGVWVPLEARVCSGLALPQRWSPTWWGGPSDCDDTSPARSFVVQAYEDADGDGTGAGVAVTQCSDGTPLPGSATTGWDCAPSDATRWVERAYFGRDEDGDGVTVPEVGRVCSGASLPPTYLAPSNGLDCAPQDPTAWRAFVYSHRDADGDGFTVARAGALCLGTSTPAGYLTGPGQGADCDDARTEVHTAVTSWADTDGDGVGAGEAEVACTQGAPPAGRVRTGTDCAPDDGRRWQRLFYAHRDGDGDGHTTPATGYACSGAALEAPYAASATGADCDDTDPAAFLTRVLYTDADGDGVGAFGRGSPRCLDETLPAGTSLFGDDVDDTDGTRFEDPEGEAEEALLLGL